MSWIGSICRDATESTCHSILNSWSGSGLEKALKKLRRCTERRKKRGRMTRESGARASSYSAFPRRSSLFFPLRQFVSLQFIIIKHVYLRCQKNDESSVSALQSPENPGVYIPDSEAYRPFSCLAETSRASSVASPCSSERTSATSNLTYTPTFSPGASGSQPGAHSAVVSGGRCSQSFALAKIGIRYGGEKGDGAPRSGAVRREPLFGGLQDVFGRWVGR